MAKVHYIIESRKKAYIEKNENDKISIVIEDVVKIEENHTIKFDYCEFINGSEKTGKKYGTSDSIAFILYFVAIILLVVLLVLLGFGKDFGILNSSYIDNIIGIVALLFAIFSIPKAKEVLGKISFGPAIVKKSWYIMMILCLPFYIVLFMSWFGLSSGISNICGILGIIICILTW